MCGKGAGCFVVWFLVAWFLVVFTTWQELLTKLPQLHALPLTDSCTTSLAHVHSH